MAGKGKGWRKGQVSMALRVRYGRVEKLCSDCGQWKDVQRDFYTRKNRKIGDSEVRLPRPTCKPCTNKESSMRHAPDYPQHGYIPWRQVQRHILMAATRIGYTEFSRRAKITPTQLREYRTGKVLQLHRAVAARMLRVAHDVLNSGEYRTPQEIHRGAR